MINECDSTSKSNSRPNVNRNHRSAQLFHASLSVQKVWGSISVLVNRHSVVAMFLRSCVAKTLNRGDGTCHLLRVSAAHRENNEDLIFSAG